MKIMLYTIERNASSISWLVRQPSPSLSTPSKACLIDVINSSDSIVWDMILNAGRGRNTTKCSCVVKTFKMTWAFQQFQLAKTKSKVQSTRSKIGRIQLFV